MSAAPAARTGAAVFIGIAAPVDCEEAEPPAEPVFSAAATCTPYAVPVDTLPETLVVYVLLEVVLAEHPAQVVHGAFVLQGPAVHPGQSVPGQAEPPHQFVHGPLVRHSEFVDH